MVGILDRGCRYLVTCQHAVPLPHLNGISVNIEIHRFQKVSHDHQFGSHVDTTHAHINFTKMKMSF